MDEAEIRGAESGSSPSDCEGGEELDHGSFWDAYSAWWAQEMKARFAGAVLGTEWDVPGAVGEVLAKFAAPYADPGSTVLEIGPGGGRFSKHLVHLARRLVLADVSEAMLRRASEACAGRAELIRITDGSLEPVPEASVDLAFAYDVFLHLELEEVFRYLAEVNRVLRPGGVFSVHLTTLESRWGFHAFLDQLRNNLHLVGRRYGGRMHPLSDPIARKLAEHSGFEVVRAEAGADSRDLLYALLKDRPARPWLVLTDPALACAFQLSQRIGGSSRRELYAGVDATTGEPVTLMLTDLGRSPAGSSRQPPVDPVSRSVPRQRALVRGRQVAAAVYPAVSGRRIADIGELTPGQCRALASELQALNREGWTHGEPGPAFLFRQGDGARLLGVVAGDGDEGGLEADRAFIAALEQACGRRP